MPWRCLILGAFAIQLTFAAPAAAPKNSAVWPEKLGAFTRDTLKPIPMPSESKLWEEYGFDAAEQAQYKAPNGKLTATAYRLKDPTGAFAVFQSLRPADATPSKLAQNAVDTKSGAVVQYGNYVLVFEGGKPAAADIKQLAGTLPKLDESSLPSLRTYLPDAGLVANSERYIVGPESLVRIEPKIPPSAAAFHLGAEAETGRFKTNSGEATLLVFSYPTPQLARLQMGEFHKIAGAMVKRTGPLLAVTLDAPNADDAERLLAGVKYEATVTLNERTPTRPKEIGDMLLGIVILGVVLAVGSVLLGMAFGGFRVALVRFGLRSANPEFTALNIDHK